MSHGKVLVGTGADPQKFSEILAQLNLVPPVLIKPNWGTVECFTEADVLDWALAAIPGEKIVIESHGWARNQETLLGMPQGKFTKANLRKGDAWFLAHSGCDAVLKKHGVEYLNLTEEVWAGRVADSDLVRQAVEEQYSPVQFDELYAKVPARLYALRGGTLLSLSKYKLVFEPLCVSFSVKNLFGLLTGPSRGKYHGKDNAFLDQSIVDIHKIYRSLFSVKGMIETVYSAGILAAGAERTQVVPGSGLVLASEDTINLDAFACALAGRDPGTVGHLRLAAQNFGGWDPATCADAAESGIPNPTRFE